jgi:hypothetical protein
MHKSRLEFLEGGGLRTQLQRCPDMSAEPQVAGTAECCLLSAPSMIFAHLSAGVRAANPIQRFSSIWVKSRTRWDARGDSPWLAKVDVSLEQDLLRPCSRSPSESGRQCSTVGAQGTDDLHSGSPFTEVYVKALISS